MPGSPFYALEKLAAATDILERQGGFLTERLLEAMVELIAVQPRDFPSPDLGRRYASLKAEVTAAPVETNRIGVTISQMSPDAVQRVADEIIALHDELSSEVARR